MALHPARVAMRCMVALRDVRIPDCTKDPVRISRGPPHDRPDILVLAWPNLI